MSKLIMWNLITLEGYFEGAKSWDLDWHNLVWGEELEQLSIEQLKSCSGLVFGRATYQGMASYWQTETGEVADLMNSIPKFVFSKTLQKADWNNSTIVNGDASREVGKLKANSAKALYIFGSANLSSTFMQHGLIDEYRIALVPVVLGQGTPLFKPGPAKTNLKLLEARPLKSGGIILRYQPE